MTDEDGSTFTAIAKYNKKKAPKSKTYNEVATKLLQYWIKKGRLDVDELPTNLVSKS